MPKLPSPPLPPLKETNGDDSKKQAAGEEDGPKLGKQELLAQLKGRRQEVERLMAKRRAEREGISVAVSPPACRAFRSDCKGLNSLSSSFRILQY